MEMPGPIRFRKKLTVKATKDDFLIREENKENEFIFWIRFNIKV
jgi:hypothetical protein